MNTTNTHTSNHDQVTNMDSNFLITELFKNYVENGGKANVSHFNQHVSSLIRDIVKPMMTDVKGKSASTSNGSSLNDHFCRGRKWVVINQTNARFAEFMNKARSEGFDDLGDLWEAKGFCWVRFHSAKGSDANFSIHPNSSVGSNVKILIPGEEAVEFEVISGTPKSNGYEERTVVVKAETQKPSDVVTEGQIEETVVIEEVQQQNDVNDLEVPSFDEEFDEDYLALANDLDIDGDIDVENF